MKKALRKILASILVAVMALTVAPMSGFVGLKLNLDWLDFSTKSSAKETPSSGSCGINVTYTFDNRTGLLTISGTGAMKAYSYGNSPFYNNSSIINVIIDNGVTSIGDEAFFGCTGLRSITIPDSVTSIGNEAFRNCSELINVTIPDSVISISSYAFYNCSKLISVKIGNSVTSIDDYAFGYCFDLTSITIPDSVTGIHIFAFPGNTVIFANKNSYAIQFCLEKNHSYVFLDGTEEDNVITEKVTSKLSWKLNKLTGEMCIDCNGNMPSFDNNNPPWYDYSNYVRKLTISDDCTRIGNNSFNNFRNLYEVIIGNNTTSIGNYSFYYCDKLTNITIPSSIISIGNYAFEFCERLTSITIPDSVTSIGYDAFSNCYELKSVYITSLETWCNISFSLNSNPLKYGGNLYLNGEIVTDLTIPDTVTKIKAYTFEGFIHLTSISIPNSVTSIGSYSFGDCTNLCNIVLPYSVTSIASSAFVNCKQLETLEIYNHNCIISDKTINVYTTILCYPGSTAETYAVENGYDYEFISDDNHKHMYSNSCDAYCNICNSERTELIHKYSAECDVECDNCGAIRTDVVHTFDNECDEECNICGFTRTPPHIDSDKNYICDICQKLISDILEGETKEVNVPEGKTIYLRFIPNNPGIYTFYSSGDNDTYGYICDSDKNEIVVDDDSGNGNNFSITYTLNEGTVYYLGVKFYHSDNSGTIPVTIHCDQIICEHKTTHTEHKDATCTETGYDRIVCDTCEEIIEENILPFAHNYVWTTVTNPTTSQTGLAVKKCTKCGDIIDEFVLPALVPDFVTGITLLPETVVLNKGETVDIIATVLPDTALNKNIVWSTTDCNIAEINNGTVFAVNPGSAFIVAETEDGGYKDFCLVRVVSITSANGSVIDNENGLIYGLSAHTTDIGEYVDLVDENMTVSCSTSSIGTGSIISVEKDGAIIDTFKAVIFGDVNGDGWYDGTDAMIVNCIANGLLSESDVGEAIYIAADCNHDGVIDQLDVDLLQQAGVLLADVDQTKNTEELLETSSAYVEYLNLIDQTVETEVVEEITPADESFIPGYTLKFLDVLIAFIKNFISIIKSGLIYLK